METLISIHNVRETCILSFYMINMVSLEVKTSFPFVTFEQRVAEQSDGAHLEEFSCDKFFTFP